MSGKIVRWMMVCCCYYLLLGSFNTITAQANMRLETGTIGDLVNIANYLNTRNRPIDALTFGNIAEGSLFFRDAWMPATLEDAKGNLYREVPVKLDLLDHRLYFLDRDGAVKEMMSSLEKITIRDSASGRVHVFLLVEGLAKAKTNSVAVWCEALETGKALLLKKTTKTQTESIPYGGNLKTIFIRDAVFYYVKVEGRLYPVKREKDLEEILSKTVPSIRDFRSIGSNKEEQWKSMVGFYNEKIEKQTQK